MTKLTALFQFLLALFGLDLGGSTLVNRIDADGIAALYSKAHVEAGVARFECLRSASGQCHYELYPRNCTPRERCAAHPIERFALASGDSRQIVGLPAFRLCVGTGDATTKDCGATPR